jgi:hypothetical protein
MWKYAYKFIYFLNIISVSVYVSLGYVGGLGIKSWQLFFPSNLNDDTTK